MMNILSTLQPDFAAKFDRIVDARRESDSDVAGQVANILQTVKQRGDAALVEFTQRFDGYALAEDADWSIPLELCEDAYKALAPDLRDALELAAARIRAYHEAQLPANRDYVDSAGVRLGAIWRPVDAAGLYVPGGRAAYPSSLLMNAIPARVAGVERLVVTTPTPKGQSNAMVLAAAHIAGVDEIWRIGGAQAVGALAYGTDRIRPVDVITGPGNAWVAEAKRQLYGVVGIDMVGPSEILVIADGKNDPDWIAADLLSQAEHDPTSQSILITDDAGFARQVEDCIDLQITQLSTGKTARTSWDAHGVMIVVNDLLAEAPALANRLAAEHVELAVDDPEPFMHAIRHAGSIFLGRMTPEAVGDYVAGPNHVLPTGRRARFSSGLSVLDFMKRTSFLGLDAASFAAIGPAAATLAHAEGLPAHAKSVELRIK
jgi:histidinol dehydrogenase